MIDGLNLETLAVISGIAYIVLAMRENSLCWYCAFFSTALYVWIFGDVSLYMESALNVYYMGMAVYGWFLWRRGGEQKAGVTIVRWPVSRHLQIVCIILLLSLGSGYLLSEHTNAHRPFVDSFTTWASVLATFMVTKKVLENWLYWILINTISIFLFIERDLDQTAAMFSVYLLLSVLGYMTWQKNYAKQNQTSS